MTHRLHPLVPVVAGVAASLFAAAAAAAPVTVALDQETVIGGVGVACTGIGQTKQDPKWFAYPVRVEFADAKRNYLAGEEVRLSQANSNEALLDIGCEGPWVLLKLAPGKAYTVEAQLTQSGTASRSASVKAPAHGQARFVLTFPDAH